MSPFSQVDYFPLMKLPRELRDKIYEAALVRDVVRIEAMECQSPAMQPPRFSPTYLRRAVRNRSVLQHIESEYNTRAVTYQAYHRRIDDEGYVHIDNLPHDFPNLALFFVNPQLYQECCSTFYSKNVFSFEPSSDLDSFGPAQACLWFLKDRPPVALHKICKTSLKFGTAERWCPLWAWEDNKVWDLFIATTKLPINLRTLHLNIVGPVPDVRTSPWSKPPNSRYVRPGYAHHWPKGLLQITGLKELKITLTADYSDIQLLQMIMTSGVASLS